MSAPRLNGPFKYRCSFDTDIRRTFARVRREQQAAGGAAAKAAAATVTTPDEARQQAAVMLALPRMRAAR